MGVRTDFSLGESAIASEDVAAIAKRLGQTHVAVADTMTVSGLIDISKACAKEGIELHMGVRLRIVDDCVPRGQEGKDINKNAYYIKAWPKNEEGMRRIYALLSRTTEEDRFFYLPRLTLDDVIEILGDPDSVGSPHVIISTGDDRGLFTRPDYQAILERLWKSFVVYNELIPVPTPYYEQINIRSAAGKQGAGEWIVTNPTFHDDGKFDRLFFNMAIHGRGNLRKSFTYADPWIKDFGPKTAAELVERIKQTAAGMKIADPAAHVDAFKRAMTIGNQAFLDDTAFRWKKQPIALPSLKADPVTAVLEQCKEGIKTRLTRDVFGYKPTPELIRETYVPRLKYELGVLKDLGFCDYFLVVSDLVGWAKSAGIMVGPGRGSVGGSLAAFLMGITDIDPIRFGLLFERFINPSRNDLPDADLDFMSTRREEIITYLEGKYGKTHVAGITNYGVLGSASALKDISRIYGQEMEFAASKFIPSVHGQPVSLEEAKKESAEISKFAETNPKIWTGALSVQGVMRSYGRHAAGTIVSGVPIVERAVVERDGESRKVNWDMRVCEDMGLVKLDVLGLSTLDTIARCVQYVKERHGGLRLDVMSIPLDDADTLKAFSQGQTIGVFQFEGGAARKILKDMAQLDQTGEPEKPVTFDDLVAANALNRPGPIDAGLVQDYIDARNGNRTIAVAHPNMKDALAETFNVIVYQEQVMRVAVDLCGFSLAEADKLRKAMGKKDPVLMASFRKQFVDGAGSHSGLGDKEAGALFDQIEVFAGYAFNKSHAAEYSLISYQCMWLKTKYPVEFYAAALSTVDEKKLQVIVNEAAKHGIKVLPPDINISTNEFVIGNDTTLFIPFNRIKGVSTKGGEAILKARRDGPFKSIADLTARVERRLCNVRVVGDLDTVGAFSRIEPGQKSAVDVSRRREQMTLLPGLMTGVITADRDLPKDKFTVAHIVQVRKDVNAIDPLAIHSSPMFGNKAKFMVVTDGPGRTEEMEKQFTKGESFQYTAGALKAADLHVNDAYWTGLVKKRKSGKTFTPSEIKNYSPFLVREIDLLKPPLILTLGSAAARFFIPDLKGDMLEHVGRAFWNEKLDAMILIGFNPNMIYHDDSKFDLLCELFDTAKTIVCP